MAGDEDEAEADCRGNPRERVIPLGNAKDSTRMTQRGELLLAPLEPSALPPRMAYSES